MRAIIHIICFAAFSAVPCFIGPAHAEAGKQQHIVIASFSFPPLLHLSDDGSFSGTMGETVKAICEDADIACTFKVVPLARAFTELRQGHVDALVTLDLGQFRDCCLASDWHAGWSAGLFSTSSFDDVPTSEPEILGRDLIVVNGMQSPYSFLPHLDALAEGGEIKLYKAKDIRTAVLMFARDRAGLLWGGEDFKWYLQKIAADKQYAYRPLFHRDVVLWVRRQLSDTLAAFNRAYKHLIDGGVIGENGLLIPTVMRDRYKEHTLD